MGADDMYPPSKSGDTLPCPVSAPPSRTRHPLAEIDQAVIELTSCQSCVPPTDDGTGDEFLIASKNADHVFKNGDGRQRKKTWAGLVRSSLYLALCQTDAKVLRGLLVNHAATIVMWIEQLDRDAAGKVDK